MPKKLITIMKVWSGVNSSLDMKQRDIVISVYDHVHNQSDEVIHAKKWIGMYFHPKP